MNSILAKPGKPGAIAEHNGRPAPDIGLNRQIEGPAPGLSTLNRALQHPGLAGAQRQEMLVRAGQRYGNQQVMRLLKNSPKSAQLTSKPISRKPFSKQTNQNTELQRACECGGEACGPCKAKKEDNIQREPTAAPPSSEGPAAPTPCVEIPNVVMEVSGETLDFPVNKDGLSASQIEEIKQNAEAKKKENPDSVITIHGFASVEGAQDYNLNLSCRRANKVKGELVKNGLTGFTFAHGATTQFSPGFENQRDPKALAMNRRVVISFAPLPKPPDPPKPVSICAVPKKASTLAEYIELVKCAEGKMPSYSPQRMLSFLRQMYYGGHEWTSAGGRNSAWNKVISCGDLSVDDPRKTLGMDLYQTLIDSQEVAGVDIGHVFAGMEAMQCRTQQTDPLGAGYLTTVNMPNEEFATWGGDLGSAAAARVHDINELGLSKSKKWPGSYFGGSDGEAPTQDLEGNIDSYVITKGLNGKSCGDPLPAKAAALSGPISQSLDEYYSAKATPTGSMRKTHYSCFAQAVGATVAGKAITNKAALQGTFSTRVNSFARAFYTNLFKNFIKTPAGIAWLASQNTSNIPIILASRYLELTSFSDDVTTQFLDWLEGKIKSE